MTSEGLDAPDMQRLRSRMAARYSSDVLADDPGFVADEPGTLPDEMEI